MARALHAPHVQVLDRDKVVPGDHSGGLLVRVRAADVAHILVQGGNAFTHLAPAVEPLLPLRHVPLPAPQFLLRPARRDAFSGTQGGESGQAVSTIFLGGALSST